VLVMGTVHLSVISSLTRQYCGCQNMVVVVVVVVVVFIFVLEFWPPFFCLLLRIALQKV
jgi:hypothetical protein